MQNNYRERKINRFMLRVNFGRKIKNEKGN